MGFSHFGFVCYFLRVVILLYLYTFITSYTFILEKKTTNNGTITINININIINTKIQHITIYNLQFRCECVDPKQQPIPTNRRAFAREIFENKDVIAAEPWFGLEQEYTLFTADSYRPLGFPLMGQPPPQGQYYCAAGVDNAFGRHLAEAHLFACLYSGLDITGNNAEVMPGSWEYQIGPTLGIDCADQHWIARYIMDRIAEDFQIKVSLSPKPVEGDWNGAGCHCNFSTVDMRSKEKGGIKNIIDAMEILKEKHMDHMALYGVGNEKRMLGSHEAPAYDEFSYAVGMWFFFF